MSLLFKIWNLLLSFLNLKHRSKSKRHKSYPKELKSAMNHINSLRKKHGVKPISIDDRALRLAKARLRDLHKYHYFGHINPRTESSPLTMKAKYGFKSGEFAAENLYGRGLSSDMHRAINAWMNSPGHRRNLLYPHHSGGAIAAYRGNVSFIGVNTEGLGGAY